MSYIAANATNQADEAAETLLLTYETIPGKPMWQRVPFLLQNKDYCVMTIVHLSATWRTTTTPTPWLGWLHTCGEASPMELGVNMIEEIYSNFYSMRGNLWN